MVKSLETCPVKALQLLAGTQRLEMTSMVPLRLAGGSELRMSKRSRQQLIPSEDIT